MSSEKKIDYIEIPASQIDASKVFFTKLLGWQFEDFGPAYSCFDDGRMKGGFYLSDKKFRVASGAPLIVFYASDLQSVKEQVMELGGEIIKDIFQFPGGWRFHFSDPSGNEFAFWNE